MKALPPIRPIMILFSNLLPPWTGEYSPLYSRERTLKRKLVEHRVGLNGRVHHRARFDQHHPINSAAEALSRAEIAEEDIRFLCVVSVSFPQVRLCAAAYLVECYPACTGGITVSVTRLPKGARTSSCAVGSPR